MMKHVQVFSMEKKKRIQKISDLNLTKNLKISIWHTNYEIARF